MAALLLFGLKLLLLHLMKQLFTLLVILLSAASGFGQAFTLTHAEAPATDRLPMPLLNVRPPLPINRLNDSVFDEWNEVDRLTLLPDEALRFAIPTVVTTVVGNTTQFTLQPWRQALGSLTSMLHQRLSRNRKQEKLLFVRRGRVLTSP
jgi:hypothetical protein